MFEEAAVGNRGRARGLARFGIGLGAIVPGAGIGPFARTVRWFGIREVTSG